MKVVGYVRVSTDKQEASGLGLDSQVSKLKAYAELYDLTLVGIHQDAASGKNLRRDGLQSALDLLKTGQAEGLIVAKLDRLTRSVKDLGRLLDDHFSSKHALFVVAEQVDTRLVLNVLMSVAQWERETISERTRDAFAVKRARGEKTGGGVPFGYEVDPDGKLIENSNEQVAITQVRILREKGYGYKSIAKALNADGYTTKQGKDWNQTNVSKLVRRIDARY